MHPLHIVIGKIILGAEISGCQVVLGKDCGGDQYIQLFCNGRAEAATRLCSVDAIVLKDGKVKIIVEIEESDIRPVVLCGKVSVSGHATYFIHRKQTYSVAPHASFVQVIDTKELPERSSKLAQCQYLREAIRNEISTRNGNLKNYEIFHGDNMEFERPEAQQEFQDHLRAAIVL